MDDLKQQFKTALEAGPHAQPVAAAKLSATVGAAIGELVAKLAQENPQLDIKISLGEKTRL